MLCVKTKKIFYNNFVKENIYNDGKIKIDLQKKLF